jgi:hypothetical protein
MFLIGTVDICEAGESPQQGPRKVEVYIKAAGDSAEPSLQFHVVFRMVEHNHAIPVGHTAVAGYLKLAWGRVAQPVLEGIWEVLQNHAENGSIANVCVDVGPHPTMTVALQNAPAVLDDNGLKLERP